MIQSYSEKFPDCPRLSCAQQVALYHRMNFGDQDARQTLIHSVIPWGIRLAARMGKNYQNADKDRMISDAMLGVIDGVDRWKPQKGSLTTWVSMHVRRTLWVGYVNDRLIRLPHNQLSGRMSTVEATRAAVEASKAIGSLGYELPRWASARKVFLGDTIEARPDKHDWMQQDRIRFLELLPRLKRIDQWILLATAQGFNMVQIGVWLRLSRERIRQRKEAAIVKLRRWM